MISFNEALLESLKEYSAEVLSQTVQDSITIPEDYIIRVLSTTFLKISLENCPRLSTITDTVVETCESINPTFHQKQSEALRDLCFKAVGDYKDCFKDTLLYREAVAAKHPNVELIQKFFKAGFDKNSALINFVFKAVQQSTSNEAKAKIVEIILHHKKSIEPEDISKAMKTNNITLLQLYFKYRSKWTGKSIPADDIIMAIESNFVELLKVCSKSDQTFKTKISTKDKKTQRNKFFDLAVEKSGIETIRYILNMLESNETKEIFLKNIIDERVINTANTRLENCQNYENKVIRNFLDKKRNILNSQKSYLQTLFQLDSDNILNIHVILNKLCNLYKQNWFFHKKFPIQNDSTDGLLQLFEQSDVSHEKDNEYEVVTYLKELATFIGLLGSHDGGIQDKFSMIPWRELKCLPFALENDHGINRIGILDARKLLEQISPDIYKLNIRLGDLRKVYTEGGNSSFEKFSRIKKPEESMKLYSVFHLTKKSIDFEVISFTLQQINILESLNFRNVNHRCAFIQCLQSIGEKYNHFSSNALIILKKFDFMKKLRNEIAHIWNKHGQTKKFLTLMERDDHSQEMSIAYFNNWRSFTVTTYKDVLVRMEANYGNLSFDLSEILSSKESNNLNPRNFLKCLEGIAISPEIEDNMPFTDSLVKRQMNLLKYIITQIQNLIKNVTHQKSYGETRSVLKLPAIHFKCILILTIIGESIHSIKHEDDYLSVADFALFKELDFLKWVRNALMHLDNIDERGTLIDYLSNDLLAEFSIATHGQKVIEFSKYFDYLSQLIDRFQNELTTLLIEGNFLQNYKGQDQLYLNFDLEKKKSRIQKTIYTLDVSKNMLPDLDLTEFKIETLLTNKVEIESEAKKLNVNILGLFGKLPIRGFTISGDLSGLLVTIDDYLFLDKISKFKHFVCNKLKYRLMVVDMRQLEEYLENKVADRIKVDDFKQKFVETATKYSLDNLENNMAFINALARKNVKQLLSDEFNFDPLQSSSSDKPLQSAIEQFFKLTIDVAEEKASEPCDQKIKVFTSTAKPLDCRSDSFDKHVSRGRSMAWTYKRKGSSSSIRDDGKSPVVVPCLGRGFDHTARIPITPLQSDIEGFSKLTIDVAEEKISEPKGEELRDKTSDFYSNNMDKDINRRMTRAWAYPRRKTVNSLRKDGKSPLVVSRSGHGFDRRTSFTPLQLAIDYFKKLTIDVAVEKTSEPEGEKLEGKSSNCYGDNANKDINLKNTQTRACLPKTSLKPLHKDTKLVAGPSGVGRVRIESRMDPFVMSLPPTRQEFPAPLKDVTKETVLELQSEVLSGKTLKLCRNNTQQQEFDVELYSEPALDSVKDIVSDDEDSEVTGENVHKCVFDVNKICFDLSLATYKRQLFSEISFGPVIHQLYDIYAKYCDKTLNGNILVLAEEIFDRCVELFAEQNINQLEKFSYKLRDIIKDAGGEARSKEIKGKKLALTNEIVFKSADIYSEQHSKRSKDNILGFIKDILDKTAYLDERQRSKRIKDNILRLVNDILDRGANINIIDSKWNRTILHKLCYEYDEAFFTVLTKNKNLNVHLYDWEKIVPLELALQYNNAHLIEFLKHKTDYKESLLIAATKAGNVKYIEYLISTSQRNANKISFNIQDDNGTPVVHCAIGLKRYNDNIIRANDENYRQVIKLLVENGAAVTSFEDKHPLKWSLQNGDIYLSQLFAEHATDLHTYRPQGGILPIHQAILNIKLFPEKREEYMRIIKQIAIKSRDKIKSELDRGSDSLLLQATEQIENREDIIELFVDNSIRGAHKYLEKYKNVFYFCKCKMFNKLKHMIIEQSLSLNTMDSDGKNIFWYAIEEKDVDFIRWLSNRGASLSLDLDFFRSYNKDTYYNHLSLHANGSVLNVLQEMRVIDWGRLEGFNIELISRDALKNDDMKAIQILEKHKYIDILPNCIKPGKVKEYLVPYLTVFRQIKESGDVQQLKDQITVLKNKSVFLDGTPLLHAAVSENHSDLINYLLCDVLDANILDYWQRSALDWAVMGRSNLNIIKILINKAVQITQNFPFDKFLVLRDDTGSEETYKILLKYITDNSDFENMLFEKVFEQEYFSDPKFLELLLELGWDPNEYEKSYSVFNGGQTVLHKCAYEGLDDCIEILCNSKKVDFELPVTNTIVWIASGPVTPVGLALENGKFNTAKLLIEHGASPFKYLQLLLLSALYDEDIDLINLLLRKSVVYDAEETRSYLHVWLKKSFGVKKVMQAMSNLLKNRDKIINMPDYIYKDLAKLALDMAEQDIGSLSLEAIYTALHIAAEEGSCSIFENLADRTDFNSLTPEQKQELLTQAEESGEESIINYLHRRYFTSQLTETQTDI